MYTQHTFTRMDVQFVKMQIQMRMMVTFADLSCCPTMQIREGA